MTSEFQDSIDNDEVVHIHAIDQDDDGTLWLGTWGDGVMHDQIGKGRAVAYLFDTIPPMNGAKNIIQGMDAELAKEFASRLRGRSAGVQYAYLVQRTDQAQSRKCAQPPVRNGEPL